VQPEADEHTKELKSSRCWKLITSELAGLDCDPKLQSMIGMFGDADECGPEGDHRTA
jgi:hypothetical protein